MLRSIRAATFWLLSFASILALLSHMQAYLRMATWMRALFPVVGLLMLALWLWARREGDTEFCLRVKAGLVGGLLGTLGYDLFRIPWHVLGRNLFMPIRAYGVWLLDASASTVWTDLVGFLYHLSNGITFGWIYALVLARRHWGWALLWGLAVESLAVATPFGEVFGLRAAYGTLVLAFVAHLFYGWPLGRMCTDPERAVRASFPLWKTREGRLVLLGTVLVTGWFLLARLGTLSPVDTGTLQLGPARVTPSWTDAAVGSQIRLVNSAESDLEVAIRRPRSDPQGFSSLRIGAGEVSTLHLDRPGIYQIQVTSERWRSVFVSAAIDGDYRLR